MRLYLPLTVLLTLFLFSTKVSTAQNIVELNASENNTLYESAEGALSNGSGDHIFAGVTNNGDIRRALLFFDLSEIPQGATIESVELQLEMNRSIAGELEMTLHEVLDDWGEGSSDAGGQEGAGGDATDGDATWIHTFFPDQTWENEGGDFNSSVISATDVGNIGTYSWPSTADFTSLVQRWLDNPSENHGLILLGDETEEGTAKRFNSRHTSTEDAQPLLIVEYSGEATSSEPEVVPERPGKVELNQNYPNPFNPQTVISFTVPEAVNVEIAVHDMLGRKIRTLVSDRVQAGRHEVTFDASDLSSGVYIYTLRTGNQLLSRRLTVVK